MSDPIYSNSITLTKQTGTVLTLPLSGLYADRDAEFTIGVQSGTGAAGSATVSLDTASGGTNNANSLLGTKTNQEPSSGYYFKFDVDGSGYSQVTSAGWLGAGNLSTASASGTYYYPITLPNVSDSITVDEDDGTISSNVTITAGCVPADIGYLTSKSYGLATAIVSGSNTVTPSASISGSNVTLSNTNNGISVTSTGGGSALASGAINCSKQGIAKKNTSLGSALLIASSTTTTSTSYISGVTLTTPESGTNTFSVTVPNGNNGTVTFQFNVDSSGNVTVTEGM